MDNEQKISEFDYERFLPKGFLETADKHSEEFKRFVRQLNFNS
jgi:hypothetical protein